VKITRFLTTILIVGFFPSYLQAQTAKGGDVENTKSTIGDTYALIIGVSDYKQLPKLKYSPADAVELKNYLVNVQKLSSANVTCLINEEANPVNIFDKLYSIAEVLKPGDRFIFYFSGHGDWESRLSDNALLLLANAPTKNYLRYPDQFINCQTLNEIFKKLSSQNIRTILIADACHSGNLSGKEPGAEATNLQLKQSEKNEIRILSCKPDEVSFEDAIWGGGRGVFSYYLTLGLEGMTRKSTSQSFDLTLDELYNYVRENVRRETDGKQTPSFSGDDRIILAHVNPILKTENTVASVKKTSGTKGPNAKGNMDTSNPAYKRLIDNFAEALTRNNLVEPPQSSALYYYNQLELYKNADVDAIRNKLLAALQNDFSAYSENYYNEKSLPKEDLIALKKEMEVAMKLVEKKPALFNQFYSKKLFLDACLVTFAVQHGFEEGLRRSEIQQAADSLEKAITLTPFEPLLYRKLGECYSPIDKLKGVMYIQKYIDLVPKDGNAWNLLGITYFYSSEYSNAIKAFQSAIKLDPQVGKYYYNMGMAYQKSGDARTANFYFQKAQRVNQPRQNTEEN
jgi:tetratricopeptide (TPR) repeat protein